MEVNIACLMRWRVAFQDTWLDEFHGHKCVSERDLKFGFDLCWEVLESRLDADEQFRTSSRVVPLGGEVDDLNPERLEVLV